MLKPREDTLQALRSALQPKCWARGDRAAFGSVGGVKTRVTLPRRNDLNVAPGVSGATLALMRHLRAQRCVARLCGALIEVCKVIGERSR